MMGALKNHRDERVSVSVEELVPQDHFLRAIEATISFDFIEEKLRPYYCENNGRPSIHPIVLFKMMFIEYFYGIRSERQLEKEIKTNIAYRCFLGFSLSDTIPDHSTISWNRRTRLVVFLSKHHSKIFILSVLCSLCKTFFGSYAFLAKPINKKQSNVSRLGLASIRTEPPRSFALK